MPATQPRWGSQLVGPGLAGGGRGREGRRKRRRKGEREGGKEGEREGQSSVIFFFFAKLTSFFSKLLLRVRPGAEFI